MHGKDVWHTTMTPSRWYEHDIKQHILYLIYHNHWMCMFEGYHMCMFAWSLEKCIYLRTILSTQFYAGGVFDEPNCSPTKQTHSMLVIGYGTYKGEQFWLVKNRWGDLSTAQVCTGSFAVQISLKTILSFWVMLRQLFAWGRGWVIAAQASSLS